MTDTDIKLGTKPVTKTGISVLLEDDELAKAFVTWTHTAWDAKLQEKPRPWTRAWWRRARKEK